MILVKLDGRVTVLPLDFTEELRVQGVHLGLKLYDGSLDALHDGLSPGDFSSHLWLVLAEDLFGLPLLEDLPVLLQFGAVLFKDVIVLLLKSVRNGVKGLEVFEVL